MQKTYALFKPPKWNVSSVQTLWLVQGAGIKVIFHLQTAWDPKIRRSINSVKHSPCSLCGLGNATATNTFMIPRH